MNKTNETPSLKIVRRFDVAPEVVFDAFTKPEAMPQFSPNSDTVSIEIEEDESGSVMTFIQSGKDIAAELRELPAGEKSASEEGWQQGFDLMAAAWEN